MKRFLTGFVALLLVATIAFSAPAGGEGEVHPAPEAKMTAQKYAQTLAYASAVQKARYEAVLRFAAAVDRAKRRAAYARLLAFVAAIERNRLEALHPHGACGGDLPPCWVMMRESHGNITIWNGGCRGCGSSASGKWQFIRSTWAGYGGYSDAAYAPEWVQDNKARELWAGGRGCSHWSAC